jgi:hypothetical protein
MPEDAFFYQLELIVHVESFRRAYGHLNALEAALFVYRKGQFVLLATQYPLDVLQILQ